MRNTYISDKSCKNCKTFERYIRNDGCVYCKCRYTRERYRKLKGLPQLENPFSKPEKPGKNDIPKSYRKKSMGEFLKSRYDFPVIDDSIKKWNLVFRGRQHGV